MSTQNKIERRGQYSPTKLKGRKLQTGKESYPVDKNGRSDAHRNSMRLNVFDRVGYYRNRDMSETAHPNGNSRGHKGTPRNAANLYTEKKKTGSYAEKMQSDSERSKEILGNAFAQKARKDYEGVPARKAAYQRGRQLKEDARRQERQAIRDEETFMEMRQRQKAKRFADRAWNRATLTAEWKSTLDKKWEEAEARRKKEEQEAAARKKRMKTLESREAVGVPYK